MSVALRLYSCLLFVLLIGCSAGAPDERPAVGSTAHGDYIVEPLLPSAACSGDVHGSTGQSAQRIFYKGRLVTAVARHPTFSPHNPARLLYTVAIACAKDGTESGTFYFDGVRDRPVQLNPLGMFEVPQAFGLAWSPDDRFVLIPSAGGKTTLANLQTGERSDYLSDLFYAKGAFSSHVGFRGWSPDGKKLAIALSSMYTREDRSVFEESDLLLLDPATLKDWYVATIREGDGWSDGQFAWVAKNGTYDLVVDSSLEDNEIVYRKPR